MSKPQRPQFLWFNGKIVPWEEGKIHVWSEVATRGANVFEGIRCYRQKNGQKAVLCLNEHLKRLFESAKLLHFVPKYTNDEMTNAIKRLVATINEDDHIYIRPTIYAEYGRYGDLYGDEEYGAYVVAFPNKRSVSIEKGLKCAVSSWRHSNDLVISPRIKAGASYQAYRLPMIEARRNNFDDAILLNNEEYVTESTGAAIFIIKDNQLFTPPISSGILDSITRKNVIKIVEEELNMKVNIQNITRMDLYLADEMFLAGTLAEITPIVKIDQFDVSNGNVGEITKSIQKVYFEICEGYRPDKWNWLTII